MGNSRATRYIGQYAHGIDDKNRLFLPARFRDQRDDPHFIMTQGLESCLFLFPSDAWDALAQKLETLPLSNKIEERAFKRTLLAAASEVEADSQGRILVPQILKDYAGIRKDAVILGMLDHVEIWAKERWEKYHTGARATFEKAARHLEL